MLRISPAELARRLGAALESGVESELGPYTGAGLELPSGRRVELVAYRSDTTWRSFELRADAGDDRRAAREETLVALKLGLADVEWPLPKGDAGSHVAD